jgi:hypothetical protein
MGSTAFHIAPNSAPIGEFWALLLVQWGSITAAELTILR